MRYGSMIIAMSWLSTSAFAALPVSPYLARIASAGDLTLTSVHPRIISPNGDGANDKALFQFDNPELLPVTGTIYDLSAATVASLPTGTTSLTWDGKDSQGRVVPGGIYLYEIDYQGKAITGTVVVAR